MDQQGIRRSVLNKVRDQRGITGLETAIILIAFIVVASVFAYTVLTAGVFSSQKANESVNAAVEEVRSSVAIKGNTIAYKGSVDIDGDTSTSDGTDAVVKIDITIAVALQGVAVDVTPAYQLNSTTSALESSGSTKTLVVNYLDQNQLVQDMAWTVAFSGANDSDFSLEPTEKAIITVWLVEYDYDNTSGLYYNLGGSSADPFLDTQATLLGNFDPFTLEISPVQGAQLTIEKVVPQSLNSIMNLR
jgi:archaeal flagellin FlaB